MKKWSLKFSQGETMTENQKKERTTLYISCGRIMKMVLVLLIVTEFLTGCRKNELKEGEGKLQNLEKNQSASTSSVNDVYGIACSNMANDMIEVYDPGVTDWNLSSALKWSWKPNTAGGWSTAEVDAWNAGEPLDVKLRNSTVWPGTSQVIVSGSGNLATIASYPAGVRQWAAIVDPGPNVFVHQGEILPNGNVAFAAMTGNWVRVYASSQGSNNTTYAQATLTGARAVLWDPIYNVLWAMGPSVLKAYTIGGTAASPTLTEDVSKSFTLSSVGLDLTAYNGNPHKLWITRNDGVFLYDKVTKTLSAAAGSAYRTMVNSISNHPQGLIAETKATTSCTVNTYCTPIVNIYNYAGTWSTTRTRTGAAFFRAKYFWDQYQDPSEYRVATYNLRRITTADTGNRDWTVRRPLVKDMITKYGFDIFGVQEPLGTQVDNVLLDLPDFSKLGVSDYNDYAYQHQDIYYKTSRFALLTSGKFWMAPNGPTTHTHTSSLDLKPWDSYYHACVCTWGKFQDKATGLIFFVFNTHFDPGAPGGGVGAAPQAKLESANLLLSKIPAIAGSSPVILMGDLNSDQNYPPYAALNGSALLDETWEISPIKIPAAYRQTGNWWNIAPYGQSQIDHIFVSPQWSVTSRSVLWDNYNGVLPSDHFPVLALIKIP